MKAEAECATGSTDNELANLHGAMNINEQLNNITPCSGRISVSLSPLSLFLCLILS